MNRRQRVKPHGFITEGLSTVIVCYGTKGQETGRLIIDTVNLTRVSKEKWFVKIDKGYVAAAAVGSGPNKNMRMHHFLFGKPPVGFEYDHENRNPLDNRRDNVRVVTASQNVRNRGENKNNSSGFRGVVRHSRGAGWIATIWFNYKPIYLGYYMNKEDAARAYNEKALELFGKLAFQNVI